MTRQGTFTVINDETLCAEISVTQQFLLYAAPGISLPVVNAIATRLETQKSLLVTVIVDLDPEVYRLGYGTEEGLVALQDLVRRHHLELRQQPGLRVGLFVSDQTTVIFGPTPLLIEAGSTSEEKPNAVLLSRDANSTSALVRACGASGAMDALAPTPKSSDVGKEAATPLEIQESLAALQDIPPKKFSVARVERVFESKIQFVDLELTGYRLSSKNLVIPNDLLVEDDPVLRARLKNSFQLLQGDKLISASVPELDPDTLEPKMHSSGKVIEAEWSERTLEEHRRALYDSFLFSVSGFGQIIMRRNRKRFDARLRVLEKQLTIYAERVRESLSTKVRESVESLAGNLLSRIRGKLPDRLQAGLTTENPTDEVLLSLLVHDLSSGVGVLEQRFNPTLRCVFKDVSYESIKDPRFRVALAEALRMNGGEKLVDQLFSEHDAAPEVS